MSTYFELHHTAVLAGGVQPNIELNVPCWPSAAHLTHGQSALCSMKLGDANETSVSVANPLGYRKLAMLQQMWHLMRCKGVTVKVTLGSNQLENPVTFQQDTGDNNLIESPLQAVTGAHKSYLPTINSRTFTSRWSPKTASDYEFHSTIGGGPAADKLSFIKLFQRLEAAATTGNAGTAHLKVEVTYAMQLKDSRNDMLAANQQAPLGN